MIVHSIDRLARNLSDLKVLVAEFNGKGVTVTFMKENLSFAAGVDDPISNLMLNMMGAFAEFERAIIRERQREGIAIAKQKGVYTGRKQVLSSVQISELRTRAQSYCNKSALAREFGISRDTLYKYLKVS